MQKTLFVRSGRGYRPANPTEILESSAHYKAREFERSRPVLTAPDVTKEFLRGQLQHEESESFCVLFLDNRHRLIAFEKMFRGTIDGASVHPREVVKEALLRNAAAVIFAHNHPSGYADPSQADELITQRLKDALALIDCRVLDHLIVGDRVFSFAESGLL